MQTMRILLPSPPQRRSALAVLLLAAAPLLAAAQPLWGSQQLTDWARARVRMSSASSTRVPGYVPDELRAPDADPEAGLAALPSIVADGFVAVRNGSFVNGCRAVRMTGFNSYTLMEMGAEVSRGAYDIDFRGGVGKSYVADVLDTARESGLSFVRTWAFSSNAHYPTALAPNVYDANMLRGLDYAVAEAGRRGLKVILTLMNNWEVVGSVGQMSAWCGAARPQDFFTSPVCRRMYKQYARALLTRVNSVSGVAYRADPAILAWELLNEPRCHGCGEAVRAWAHEMAAYLKRVDPAHLVTIGEEGFWASGPHVDANPSSWAQAAGQDFVLDHDSPHIDFATTHLWMENWGDIVGVQSLMQPLSFAAAWLQAHATDATTLLRKPLILTEYGRSLAVDPQGGTRNSTYALIISTVEAAVAAGTTFAGTAFWDIWPEALRSVVAAGDEYAVFASDDVFSQVVRHAGVMRAASGAPSANGHCPTAAAIV